MSQYSAEMIECPHCHHEGEFKVWTSINANLNPELREQILSEELFMFHCPYCGQTTGIPAGTVYHDMENKFMLFFEFFKPEDFNYSSSAIPKEVVEMRPDYKFRTVYGLMELKEKIITLENELDDIAVERFKYILGHVLISTMAASDIKLYLVDVTEPDEEHKYGQLVFLFNDENNETQVLRLPKEKYFEHKYACSIDPRFSFEEGMCVDQDLMDLKLREE